MSTSDHILRQVIGAFQEFFPNANINIKSDFFDLGGDSLILANLCISLETKLGIEVAPSTLLYHPSVEEFASAIDHDQKEMGI